MYVKKKYYFHKEDYTNYYYKLLIFAITGTNYYKLQALNASCFFHVFTFFIYRKLITKKVLSCLTRITSKFKLNMFKKKNCAYLIFLIYYSNNL